MALYLYNTEELYEGFNVKPCPFCGNEHLYITRKDMFDKNIKEGDTGTACISIRCEECKTEMTQYGLTSYDNGVDMLILKWNNRVKGEE